MNKPIKREWGA